MKKIFFMGVVGTFLLGSCQNPSNLHSEEEHAHEEHAHAHNHANNEIVMSKVKAETAGVQVSVIQPGTFHQVIKTSGQISAAQGEESTVVATVSGVVSFAGKVYEGMAVSKNNTLLYLSSRQLNEGDPVEKARIAFETARKDFERVQKLVKDRIVSEKEYLRTKQAYENAKISYQAVETNHSNGGQKITATLHGYVKQLLVQEGDYVTIGQPLLSITQNRRLSLRADVSERYYSQLHQIQSANFCTPYNSKTYQLSELNGKLLSFGKSSENNYYIPVTFEFDNTANVVPGSLVEVYLLSDAKENVLSIPHTALTEEQGSFFVYRQLDEECYQKQLVELGADNGIAIEIRQGLHAGDKIVTQGAYQVKLAGTSNAIPGHTHQH